MTEKDADYYEERELTTYTEAGGGGNSGNTWKIATAIFAALMIVFAALWFYYPVSNLGFGGGEPDFDELKQTTKGERFAVSFERTITPYWYLAEGFDTHVVQYVNYTMTNVTDPAQNNLTIHFQNWTFRAVANGTTIVTFVLPSDVGGASQHYRIKIEVD